ARASALAVAERFNRSSYVIMIRSMAASMDPSRLGESGFDPSGLFVFQRFEPGDRPVGQSDLVELAALEQLHDDRQQLLVGRKTVDDGAGPAQVVGGDRI